MRVILCLIIFNFISCSKLADTFNNEDDDKPKTTNSGTSTVNNFLFSNALASVSDLTECTTSNQGQIYYISSIEEFRGCNGAEWESVELSNKKTSLLSFEMISYCDTSSGTSIYSSGYFDETHYGSAFVAPENGILKNISLKYVGSLYGSFENIPSGLEIVAGVAVNNAFPTEHPDLQLDYSSSLTTVGEYNINRTSEVEVSAGDVIGLRIESTCSGSGSLRSGNFILTLEYEY